MKIYPERSDKYNAPCNAPQNQGEIRQTKHSLDVGTLLKSKSTIDVMKSVGFAFLLGSVFCVTFLMWRVLSLGNYLPVCGLSVIDCNCSWIEGSAYAIRVLFFNSFPFYVFVFAPFHYYQHLGFKFVAYGGFVCSIATVSMIFLRDFDLAIQTNAWTLVSVVLLNAGYYYVDGMEGVKNNQLFTAGSIWVAIVGAGQSALSHLNPSWFPMTLPCFTMFIDCLWFTMSANGMLHCDMMSTIIVWAVTLGIVSGVSFNSYLTATTWEDYIKVSVMNCGFGSGTKLFACWSNARSEGLNNGLILYTRLITYVEYIPAIAYMILYVSDFSPLGRMVETTVHGCSGSPILPQYGKRWLAVVILVLTELLSDFAVYHIAHHVWDCGFAVQPLRFDSWLQYFLFFGTAIVSCIAAIECCAVVFKASVDGGAT